MKKYLKILLYIGMAGLAIFVIIQFVPYGRNHTNPPINSEPPWDSPQTRQLVKDHCFQCHSNEYHWTQFKT